MSNYCSDPGKFWVVSYGSGNTCVPTLISDGRARERFPELKFEHKGKTFVVQFYNITDWIAARDSSITVKVHILSGNRKNRVEGTIIHQKINENGI